MNLIKIGDGPLDHYNKQTSPKDWMQSYTRTVYVTKTEYATVTVPPGKTQDYTKDVFPTEYPDFGGFGKSFSPNFGPGQENGRGCQAFQNNQPPELLSEPKDILFPAINEEALKPEIKDMPDYFPTPPYTVNDAPLEYDHFRNPKYHEIREFLHPSLGYEGYIPPLNTPTTTHTPSMETLGFSIHQNTKILTLGSSSSGKASSSFSTLKTSVSFVTTSIPTIVSIQATATDVTFTTKTELTTEKATDVTTVPEKKPATFIDETFTAKSLTTKHTASTTTSSQKTSSTKFSKITTAKTVLPQKNTTLSPSTSSHSSSSIHPEVTQDIVTTTPFQIDLTIPPDVQKTTDKEMVEAITTIATTKKPLTKTTKPITIRTTITSPTSPKYHIIPSPSNNESVPLDKHYWVRTLLNGIPDVEDKIALKNEMKEKLTEVYRTGYKAQNQNDTNKERRKRRYLDSPMKINWKRLFPVKQNERKSSFAQITSFPFLRQLTRNRRQIDKNNIKIRIQNITNYEKLNMTELIYSVFLNSNPIPALEAVAIANKLNHTDIEEIFNQSLAITAEGT